jgi:hypothetical protein
MSDPNYIVISQDNYLMLYDFVNRQQLTSMA